MLHGLLIFLALISLVIVAAILVGRYLRLHRGDGPDMTPVTRQHLELYQGGQLNEAEVNSAKRRYREWLEQGDIERVESSLRPGVMFVVKVRALAEIGTEDACRILERQLRRRMTPNRIEQSWYWIDLANSLRMLGREESLPALLETAAEAEDFPLMHHFAAETVCFVSFAGHLRDIETPTGLAALRLLHRAVEGLRLGLPPQIVVEARLGEVVETLWDNRPAEPHPLLIRLFVELRRLLRRAGHAEEGFGDEPFEREAFHLQRSRLVALEPALDDYLHESGPWVTKHLSKAQGARQRDMLGAIYDLRHDAGDVLTNLLKDPQFPFAEQAVMCLRWARDPEAAGFLREWATLAIGPHQRALRPLKPWMPRRASVPPTIPYRPILYVLRDFPSTANEQFLLVAAHDWDPTYRAVAISSLCWWEPFSRAEVLLHLQDARFDPSADVRHAARAALARLGERQALQWFRQALCSDNRACVMEAIQAVAQEELTLLWPDLDRLVDVEEPDLAFCAREALEQMQEEMEHRRGR
jgi:hypothetical protein